MYREGRRCKTADAAAQVAPDEAQRLLTAPAPPILVDVRTGAEYGNGHLRNALHVPVQEFIFGAYAKKLGGVSKDDPIILYCRSGRRSGIAQQILVREGCSGIKNLKGGMIGWKKAGLPFVESSDESDHDAKDRPAAQSVESQ